MPSKFNLANGGQLALAPFVLACTRSVLPKVRKLQERRELDAAVVDEQLELKIDLLEEALRRANKDVTREWILENVESRELDALVLAVLDASGLKAAEAAPGEAPRP